MQGTAAVYNSLRTVPMLQPQELLCGELERVNANLMGNPCCATAVGAINFLERRKLDISRVFGQCAWAYACAPQPNQPEYPFADCTANVTHALRAVLQEHPTLGKPCQLDVQSSSAWNVALDVWSKFHLAITSGCCARLPNGDIGARYVIRTTPNVSPYYGRTVCMPTLTPARVTERQYNSLGECEMALSQLPPQADYVPYQAQTYCNEFGCFLQPQWSRKPVSVLECQRGVQGSELGQVDCSQYGCWENQWGRDPGSNVLETSGSTCGPQLELGPVSGFMPY